MYVLDGGSVFEEGTHETLMSKEGGKYRTMVKRQHTEAIGGETLDMRKMKEVY